MNNKAVSDSQDKAGILVDSLPYIRDFNQKVIIICFCASNLLNDAEEQEVMRDVALLKSIGMKPIVVHDTRMGYDKFRENKRIAKLIEFCGIKAVGICGADMQTIRMTLDNDYIPVITPNDIDTEDILITPEECSRQIAEAIQAEKVILLGKEDGIHSPEDGSVIAQLKAGQVRELLPGISDARLLNKVKESLQMIDKGIARVHILDATLSHAILLEMFSVIGVGTMMMADDAGYYPHEIRYRQRKAER